MQYFWIIVFGIFSGVLGGMGMGGGTLLIPLLGFLDMPQQAIQAANLISFIPMAVVTLSVHKRNGLLKTDRTGYMIFPAVAFAIVGAVLPGVVDDKVLKGCFGIMLLVLGVMSFFTVFSRKNAQE